MSCLQASALSLMLYDTGLCREMVAVGGLRPSLWEGAGDHVLHLSKTGPL